MELSMNTSSKMRTRRRIPCACWERKIEAQAERERGRAGQMDVRRGGQRDREGRMKEEIEVWRRKRKSVASLGTGCQASPGL